MLTEESTSKNDPSLNYVKDPKAGPLVMFLHGLTDRWQFFVPIMPAITQR
jgi:hypothetical protein